MIVVRPIAPDECDRVGALTARVYVGEGYVAAADPYAATLADTATRAADADVLVAVRDDEVVGSVTVARPGTSYAAFARPDELEFRMLAVEPAARGHRRRNHVGAVRDRRRTERRIRRGGARHARVDAGYPADLRPAGFVHRPDRDYRLPNGIVVTVMSAPITVSGRPRPNTRHCPDR